MDKKFIVLVIDSFGVGEMPDVAEVRPQDIGANTCEHILQQSPQLHLPMLEKLGLMNVLGKCYPPMTFSPHAVYGTALLQHQGGDTFMGHQEIMGSKPKQPLIVPFMQMIDPIESHLIKQGYQVERIVREGLPLLWVNRHIAVGDNLEADLGQVYNITGNISAVGFDAILNVGKAVREIANVGRVIAFGGLVRESSRILAAIETKQGKYIGVNAPKSGAYEHGFQVAHLGYGVEAKTQAPYLLQQQGIPTVLIGKVADIVENSDGVNYRQLVDSDEILALTLKHVQQSGSCFICSNIQETDLAGHAQNVARYADRLQVVDRWLEKIMAAMKPQDYLVVLADHGNDPTIGHSRHTREKVPLLVYRQQQQGYYLGERATLSDVGASVCDFFAAQTTENGTSFLRDSAK
ncbi:phosphopentomutase [Testudinibacter sp. TR-2022]|uniref:phosphopentomutase n=1 Tax=Testudinibacter sp. TR-2022 TaxID=2585029 RepID=UPI0011198749|nr:phosphopentomutase [Testudinibacter sp. TR-2022]TNH05770.1 phosphopentomutase [Pasteurellaceae bacterium Phil11]TNH22215.1 phosphopentomutase [Testudinibacter sp. TR-2022]TNH25814.1 phosphopentomutase [Testudinibacter sp. TR-2022]